MSFEEIKEYKLNDSLLIRKVGEIAMVYNKENGDMYEFNDVGADILALLVKGCPIQTILESLAELYDTEPDDIKEDVSDFITRMIELNIVLISEDEKKELFSITYDSNLLVNEYLDLRKFVGWEEISAKQSQKSIENSDGIVVCRCNGNAIGCIRYIWDKGYTVFIVDAIVKPEWQRKGIGSTMLNYLLSMIDSKVGEGEKIMLNLYSSAGKEEFYKRAGFTTGTGMVKWIRK